MPETNNAARPSISLAVDFIKKQTEEGIGMNLTDYFPPQELVEFSKNEEIYAFSRQGYAELRSQGLSTLQATFIRAIVTTHTNEDERSIRLDYLLINGDHAQERSSEIYTFDSNGFIIRVDLTTTLNSH
jgi:hypothetical protein